MTDATLAGQSRLWPALLWFSVAYLFFSAAVSAVLFYFNLDASSPVAFGVVVAAVAIAVRRFVIDHGRSMTRGEQLRFALLTLAATALITLLQVIVFVIVAVPRAELPALIDEVRVWIAANKGILTFVVAVTVIFYFVVLFAAADGFSRWFGKRLAATGKI